MKRTSLTIMGMALVLVLSGIFTFTPPASAAEKTKITLITGRPSDPWTVLTYALSQLINKNSTLIKSSVLTSGGTGDSRKILLAEPERRKNSTAISIISTAQGEKEKNGMSPLFIGMIAEVPYLWMTYDKNIKTLKDFEGKRIAGPRKTVYGWYEQFSIPLELAGVLDKVDMRSGGSKGAMNAIIDGTADIAWTMCDFIYPDTILKGSRIERAQVRGDVYFPDWGKDRIEIDTSNKIGFHVSSLTVPPKTLGPAQTSEIHILKDPMYWSAYKEMDNEIVYEIAKILYEQASKDAFKNFHNWGKGLSPKFVPHGPWTSKEDKEKWYHPGALKFYRDAKVPGF